jgi:uncharacterized membrane protein
MATYQLTWFLAPFLAVAMWRIRRGELASREAVFTVARYVGFALATFAVVNAPFAAIGFSDWWHDITVVLTEHAVIYGPGIAMISGNLTPGSGALDFFGYAAAVAYVGLLVTVAVLPARLSAAATILPIVIFWLAIRSEDTYYVVFAPLWVLAVVVAARTDFAAARPLALAQRFGRRGQVAAAGIAIAAVVGCLAVGLATPSPLLMTVVSAQRSTGGHLRTVELSVHNRSGHSVHPSFVLLGDAQLGVFWTVEQGPASLSSGQTAGYLLSNPDRGFQPAAGSALRLEAVSDDPQTLSSVSIPP